MNEIKLAVMRTNVDGIDRIILQGVRVYGRCWVRARDQIVEDTAQRIGNRNVTWLGWFDEVDRPALVLNVKPI